MPMRRRTFVALASLSVLGRPWAQPARMLQPPVLPQDPFTLGVASGDPKPQRIVLWTRLAPDPLGNGGMPSLPAEVTWELGLDRKFAQVMRQGQAIAWAEHGHALHVRVGGLKPATRYFYRFRFGRYASRVGTFRTAPAENADVPARIGVVSCNRYEDGWFHAFRHLANEDLDLVLHTGDYIYTKVPRPERPRAFEERECMTLDDYRRRYARYRLDGDLQRLHAAVPFTGIWDDHEVAGNWAGSSAKGGIPDPVFAVRRAAAFQAFWEAMPFELEAPVPGGELRQYRTLNWGRNARLIQLDTRQYRADQACGDRTTALCDEAFAPGREMLGQRQSEWLAGELAGRGNAWPLVAQGVPPLPLDHAPGEAVAVPMDKWSGYPHARDAFERQLAVAAPVVTLAGDLHGHYAATRSNPDTGEHAGADFVTTSISSAGDGREHDLDWPVLQAENPELVYHSRRRGYLVIDADTERVEADFRIVDRITTKAHKFFSDARAIVAPDGRLEVDDERRLLREVKAAP